MPDRPRENAVCLYAVEFSETSQVAHFLARETGIVHLLAKGSRRAKSSTGGPLDLLSEGELVFIPSRREGLATLVEFTPSSSHTPLRQRLATLNAALYMVEVTRMLLAEADPHPAVFDLLSAALARLDKPDAPAGAVLAYFQWRLLRHVGLLGDMGPCCNCGKQARGAGVYFTSREGGPLCRDCEVHWSEKVPLTADHQAGLDALRAMARRQPARLTDAQANALNALLAYHITYQTGREPRLWRHVRSQ